MEEPELVDTSTIEPVHSADEEDNNAPPTESIKYFNSKPIVTKSLSIEEMAHEEDRRKHFQRLGSAAFVGKLDASGNPTSPPSSGGRGGATPNALTGGRLGTGGRQPVQRRRTYAASSDAGPSAPLFDTAAPKPQNAAAITKGPADKRAEKCTEKSSLDIPAIPARDMKVIPEYASSVSQGQGRAAPTPPTPPVSKTSAPSREGSPAAPSSSAPRNHSPFTPNAEASGSLYSPDSAASTPTVASANIASAAAASTTTSIAAAQAEAALSPMAPRRSLAASLFSSAAEDEAEGETADCAQQAQVPAAPVPAQYVAACSAGAVNPPRQATEEQETHVVDIEAKEHCKKASPSASPSPAPSTATTVPISSSGNSAGSSPNTVLRNSGGKWPPVQTTHHSGGANTSNSNGADSGRTIQRVSSASSTGSFGQALKVTNVQHPAGAQLHLSGTSSGTSTSTGSAAAAGGAAASSGARSEQEQGQEQVLSHAERAQALVAAGKVSVKDRIKSYETLATSSTDTNSGGKKGEAGGVGGAAGDAGTITKKAVRRWSVHSSTAANTSS